MTHAEFRHIREQLGYSQIRLAELLGASRRTIINIESGECRKFRLYELALKGLMAERLERMTRAKGA